MAGKFSTGRLGGNNAASTVSAFKTVRKYKRPKPKLKPTNKVRSSKRKQQDLYLQNA